MDSKQIDELLSKYWECETSLDEEQQLREFFTTANVPEKYKETAVLFHYFDESKKKSLDNSSFDGQVMSKLNVHKSGKVVKLMYNAMRIAAGVAVLVLAAWFVHTEVRKSTPQELVDTYDDPQMAFEETKRVLMMISKNFGRAEEQAKKINLFNEAQEEIQKETSNEIKL